MQAVQYTDHGGRDVVEYGPVADPEPGPEAVLVDVRAGALNHLDVWTRNGLPGLDLDLPHVPGSDAAGVVEAVGDRVSRFAPGDRVAVPPGVDWATAAAAPLVFQTAWQMLVTRADASPGETVLVHGASGKVVVVPDSEYSS